MLECTPAPLDASKSRLEMNIGAGAGVARETEDEVAGTDATEACCEKRTYRSLYVCLYDGEKRVVWNSDAVCGIRDGVICARDGHEECQLVPKVKKTITR